MAMAKDGRRISHEKIYQIIRKDKAQGGDSYTNCRHRLKHRRHAPQGSAGRIPDRTSITERPPEADGTRFGDFEMDTIVGKRDHGAIVTLVERSTNKLIMRKLNKGKNAKELARTVIKLHEGYKGVIRTITTDNGPEFAEHRMITERLGVPVYFTDPYSS